MADMALLSPPTLGGQNELAWVGAMAKWVRHGQGPEFKLKHCLKQNPTNPKHITGRRRILECGLQPVVGPVSAQVRRKSGSHWLTGPLRAPEEGCDRMCHILIFWNPFLMLETIPRNYIFLRFLLLTLMHEMIERTATSYSRNPHRDI